MDYCFIQTLFQVPILALTLHVRMVERVLIWRMEALVCVPRGGMETIVQQIRIHFAMYRDVLVL